MSAQWHVENYRDQHFPVPPDDPAEEQDTAAGWNGYSSSESSLLLVLLPLELSQCPVTVLRPVHRVLGVEVVGLQGPPESLLHRATAAGGRVLSDTQNEDVSDTEDDHETAWNVTQGEDGLADLAAFVVKVSPR